MSDTAKPLTVRSMFGYHSRKGLVVLQLGVEMVQITPEDARELAMHLLEASEAAVQDELTDKSFAEIGLDELGRARIMELFRKNRAGRGQADYRMDPWSAETE